ncbi:MAG TPA: PA2169 family four-helix-bundle protein [Candidatus Angelobacter sp.]
MSRGSWIGMMEKLIETCKDGESGYREAAEHVKNPALKRFLEEQSNTRGRFAQELKDELARISDEHSEGSRAAAAHRTLIGLQALLGVSDRALMNSVQQGERIALDAYQAALSGPLPPQLENIVRRQAEGIRQAYEKAMRWKEDQVA